MGNTDIQKLNNEAKKYSKIIETMLSEVQNVIVGQDEVLKRLLISIIADGHVLLEGVPGLAKTLMIKSISDTISTKFQRIQFTPDLLPADIIGTKIYSIQKNTFSTKKGPIFCNFMLADEINRAPPKCQSALLEAMQERQVTIGEETFKLDKPFFVLATQNPIETEGTYKLPEAQVDRFLFKVLIGHPVKKEEKIIIDRMTEGKELKIKRVVSSDELKKIQKFNLNIYADDKIKNYVVEIVNATRNPKEYGLEIDEWIEYGASPRASVWLIIAAKANALINGRGYVIPEDVKEIVHDVLRHRVLITYEAEAEGITSDQIIDKIIEKVKVP